MISSHGRLPALQGSYVRKNMLSACVILTSGGVMRSLRKESRTHALFLLLTVEASDNFFYLTGDFL